MIKKIILLLVPSLGTVSLWGVLTGKGIDLPLWILLVFFLVMLFVFWASLTAGIALVKSQEPWVELSKLMLDDQINPAYGAEGVLYIRLENGDIPITPIIQIVDVTGGDKVPERTYMGHWRGIDPHKLAPGEMQQFGVLGVGSTDKGNPALFTWESLDLPRIVLTKDVPIEQQAVLTIKINILCEYTAEKDKPATSQEVKIASRQYKIAPDARSQSNRIKYRAVN